MKQKILTYNIVLIICIAITSCVGTPNFGEPITESEDSIHKSVLNNILKSKKDEYGIFEVAQFALFTKDIPQSTLTFIENFDSIVWNIKGFNSPSFIVFNYVPSKTYIAFTWSQNFFLPGDYISFLSGYKGGKVIDTDSISFKVYNKRDFLCFNWKEITESDKITTGYHDNFLSHTFSTRKIMQGNTPSVYLYCRLERSNDLEDNTKQLLFEQISSLYGQPTFSDNNSEILSAQYNQLFSYKEKDIEPKYIWKTNKSNIVLLADYDEIDETFNYFVYAEPS